MKKVVNWTFGSIFRTFGRIIAYIIFGLIISIVLTKSGIKLPKFLSIVDNVSAATIIPTSHRFSVFYGNLSCNVSGTNCYANDDKSSGWTNYSAGYSTPSGYYGLSDVYLEIKTGNTMLQPGVTYTFNFDHWYNERNSSNYYSKNTYTLAGSDSGGWSGNSEAFIRNLVCTSGISEGTTQRVSYSCSFQITKPLNYFYMGIHYLNPSGRSNSIYQFISFGANLGSFVYDNAQVDSINNQTTIINQQTEKIINAQNETNDILNNDDVDESLEEADSFFSDFTTNTHGLTGIITAPLTAIESLTSKTCSPLVLPLPFVNQNLTLPCMRDIYVQNFGGFMTLYDAITLGIVSYWIMVRIFALVKDFKNPDHDEIEVVDL